MMDIHDETGMPDADDERKRHALAVRDSEAKFAAIFRNTPAGIGLSAIDDNRLIEVNDALLRMFGQTREEMIGKTSTELGQWVDDEARERLIALLRKDQRVEAFQARFRHSSGRIGDLLISAEIIELSGRRYLLRVLTDITDMKKSETESLELAARYRRIFESMHEGVILMDQNLRISFVNQALSDIIGYTSAELIGTTTDDLLFPEDLAMHQARVADRKRGATSRYESRYRRKDGSACRCSVSALPLHDASGALAGIFGLFVDVTPLRDAEQARVELEGRLQQAQKMEALGQLAGGIAHDFNNLLGSILGYSNLALSRFVPDKSGKLAQYLGEVIAAGERGRDLVTRMLAYTHSEVKAPPPLTDLADSLGHSLKLLEVALPPGIVLRADVASGLPAIPIHAADLSQIVANLVLNARDAIGTHGCIDVSLNLATDPGGSCALCRLPVQGRYVVLAVTDNGSGIAATVLPRIFDPFFTTREIGKGTGLGLSVVQGIVARGGGHVQVDTTEGKGTSIRIYLPVPSATASS